MTRQQALDLIKQVAAQFRGTLQEHQLLQEAIKTLEPEQEKEKSED